MLILSYVQMVREAARIYLIFKWLKFIYFFKKKNKLMENKHIFLQNFQNIKKIIDIFIGAIIVKEDFVTISSKVCI